jgi:hypothetical protein
MFRALIAHLQEAQLKWHLVYCVRIVSVAFNRIGAPRCKNGTWYIACELRHLAATGMERSSNPVETNWQIEHNIPSAVSTAPPEDEQVMLETCRGP